MLIDCLQIFYLSLDSNLQSSIIFLEPLSNAVCSLEQDVEDCLSFVLMNCIIAKVSISGVRL